MTSRATTDESVILRRANFDDTTQMAQIAIAGYDGTALTNFLSPWQDRYPKDFFRGWCQRMCLRWLDPRNICQVACLASNPRKVVGYTVFQRLGDDEGAKQQLASRKSLWLVLQFWYYSLKFKIMNYFWPDRSEDPAALAKFVVVMEKDDKKYWAPYPERQNRWHVRSCVVHPEWQGKGIGTNLMKEVVSRARKEGVVIGIEASKQGVFLYRKFGFEMMYRFAGEGDMLNLDDGGGIMIWKPEREITA